MKKIILILFFGIVAYGAASRYERHNIFLGAGVGMDHQMSLDDYAFAWSIFGGYEFKPIREIGTILYLESFMSIKPHEFTTRIITQLSVNADTSLEIFKIGQYIRMGPYLGVGFGYANTSPSIQESGGMNKTLFFTNVGLQMSIDESNIARLGVKIPFDLKEIHTDGLELILAYAYKF